MDAGHSIRDDGLSRAYKTKLRIAQALNELCQATPFARLPIDMIAAQAGVSRSSFYHHFADKNAVVLWLTEQFYANGIDQTGRTLTWFEGHLNTTRGMQRYKTLFLSAAENNEFSAGMPFFARHRVATLKETITQWKHLELTDRLNFQIEALPHAEMVMSNKYESGELNVTLKQFCDLMVSLVPHDLYEALKDPVRRETLRGDFFL
ncbi:MAG: TetR/AcrR family transcriptional regulator [Coriobacteriales bacterium]|jgi:AcrR family transcriptional regulator|nr:TetR/AcrR family transcriptional regulator [Coriobacteriales bacterium]